MALEVRLSDGTFDDLGSMLLIGFFQPVLAFVGGLTSYLWVTDRRR